MNFGYYRQYIKNRQHIRIHTVIWPWLSHFFIVQPSVFDPKTETKKNFKQKRTLNLSIRKHYKKQLYNNYRGQKTSKKWLKTHQLKLSKCQLINKSTTTPKRTKTPRRRFNTPHVNVCACAVCTHVTSGRVVDERVVES